MNDDMTGLTAEQQPSSEYWKREYDLAREEVGHEKAMRKHVSEQLDRWITLQRRTRQGRDEALAALERVMTGDFAEKVTHAIECCGAVPRGDAEQGAASILALIRDETTNTEKDSSND